MKKKIIISTIVLLIFLLSLCIAYNWKDIQNWTGIGKNNVTMPKIYITGNIDGMREKTAEQKTGIISYA